MKLVIFIMRANVINVCGECRLYQSRKIITRSRDRRSGHRIDCTGTLMYVI
ncbi:hypothetical protein HanPI659440_Chr01g0027051 [Helianthus annuus]|nr:hypothetical protein HanPI659440_Chr01g0027051 [Helianthus annuus]